MFPQWKSYEPLLDWEITLLENAECKNAGGLANVIFSKVCYLFVFPHYTLDSRQQLPVDVHCLGFYQSDSLT